MRILFLTLRVFSLAGGIERVCRVAGKAMNEMDEGKTKLTVFSMYGKPEDIDEQYFPADIFHGYNVKKTRYVFDALKTGRKSNVVILSHINLLLVGYLIKLFSPKTKVLLFAHGIEVWKKFPWWKKYMIQYVDRILPVSQYTKEKMIALNGIKPEKFWVLNNCLDPFLPVSVNDKKDGSIMNKYGIKQDDFVLMTLSRLSEIDRYKGYDKVIEVMQELIKQYPQLKYLLVGKYDDKEKKRLDKFIAEKGLSNAVILAGFIPDNELAFYYNLADVFIMPSKKEGFGIAFIEALYYGKPVIAGNKDGSVDALLGGKLGLLIDPDDNEQIRDAISTMINNRQQYLPDKDLLMKNFSYDIYKNKLKEAIQSA